MRATTKISNNNSLYYINKNFNSFMKVSNQIALEQQVVKLEDDPLSSNIGIKMLNIIARSEQYNRNIKTGIGALNLTDGYLGSSKTIMDSVKTIVTGAAQDATANSTTRAANAIELNEILKSLVSAGNAHDGSRYIFGGQNTTTPPFTIVNGRYVNYVGNESQLNVNVDNGTTVAINVTGNQAYGNMITTMPSRDMNPDVSLATDRSTRLDDLNGGSGVPAGKIKVYYSAYPEGLEIDISACDTLEDVKDVIEKTTLEASRNLDPRQNAWLDGSDLDWRDLTDRYVKVTLNPEHNGISLQEFDLGEPLPPPTPYEQSRGLDYSNDPVNKPGYHAGGLGVNHGGVENVETTVHDKNDFVYQDKPGAYYQPIRVENVANNKVADALGIKGSAPTYDPAKPDRVLDGFIHGKDLNPVLSDRTLLADLEGYNDSVYTLTNGAKPGSIVIRETSQDANNVFSEWNLTGLSKGKNTGANGELYARAVNRGTATQPDIYLEIYTKPIASATAADLVATGAYTGRGSGGTVVVKEANNSGLGGTVGVLLPQNVGEASVNLKVDFSDTLQATVHVPAFVEEQDAYGHSRDALEIFSGWNIRGLDKPPSDGYDRNHPASTDLDGDVSVNYRYDQLNNRFIVELCRPSFNDQPAKVVATGHIDLGAGNTPPLAKPVSGRIEFTGAEGFEGVKGSVYVELPSGTEFTPAAAVAGADADHRTSNTYQLQSDAPAGAIVLGGAMELVDNLSIDPTKDFYLAGDTVFKKGQTFLDDVHLPNGSVIKAGTTLERDMLFPKGVKVVVDELQAGTVLAEGQKLTVPASVTPPATLHPLAAGTVVPRGSYYESAGAGFPAGEMAISVTRYDPETGQPTVLPKDGPVGGFDLRATFATIEDFNRAVEEAGIYVRAQVSADGRGIEFQSSLAGAWLTVSEDTDCYEQMGDKYQQLTGLDLNGLVKGVNSDNNGNVYTEVIYYPPDPNRDDNLVALTSEDGEIVEIEAGYYVRVYSDPEELKKPYEDRDNGKMVAEGHLASPALNPGFDPNLGYIAGVNEPFLTPPSHPGAMDDLILEERNDSGVWGRVDLDYYGGRDPVEKVTVVNPDNTTSEEISYNPWGNANITVFPGGLRPEGSRHATIQEWDVNKIVPGVTCDYTGTFHGTITANDPVNAANKQPTIRLYKDASHTVMTMRTAKPGETYSYGNPPVTAPLAYRDADGNAILYEVDKDGNIALDADNNPIVLGGMKVTADVLPEGETDSFRLTTGANRNYGQEREENVFSTINDIIDALNRNDVDELHNLIGSIQKDIDHILEARGDAAARNKRLQMLSERHADDQVKYKSTLVSRVGMDDQALAAAIMNYQAASNAYQAAMQVSGQIMQMSLLQFI